MPRYGTVRWSIARYSKYGMVRYGRQLFSGAGCAVSLRSGLSGALVTPRGGADSHSRNCYLKSWLNFSKKSCHKSSICLRGVRGGWVCGWLFGRIPSFAGLNHKGNEILYQYQRNLNSWGKKIQNSWVAKYLLAVWVKYHTKTEILYKIWRTMSWNILIHLLKEILDNS